MVGARIERNNDLSPLQLRGHRTSALADGKIDRQAA